MIDTNKYKQPKPELKDSGVNKESKEEKMKVKADQNITSKDQRTKTAREWYETQEKSEKVQVHCPLAPDKHNKVMKTQVVQ